MIFDFLQTNWFEIVAALLAITYLLLAMLQDIRCWIAWIISSIMYLFVMYSASLYMEALLQIFYIFIGFYGLYQWRFKSDLNDALKRIFLIIRKKNFPKKNIIFSPSAASFDSFENFEERGDYFNKLIKKYLIN